MCIESWRGMGAALLMAAFFSLATHAPAIAATIETQDDDTDIGAPPAPAGQDKGKGEASGDSGLEAAAAKARINDLVGFYYLVESGFVARDPARLPSLGKVIGSFDNVTVYGDPLKMYVELSNGDTPVRVGDILVVYRAQDYLQEPHTGFTGYWIQNLAFVKVLELQKRQCLVQSLKSFIPFRTGDSVKSYDDEIKRWRQAQTKKDLPDHPVSAFVVAGRDPSTRTFWGKKDPIILSAGTKKGVVEGQTFRLFRVVKRPEGDPVHIPVGSAQVFYAGPDYSMAQIDSSSSPVQSGFEARYEP